MANWKMLGVASLIPLAALAQAAAKPAPTPPQPVMVYNEMHNHVVPKAQTLWDITNATLDDDGNPSPKKMKPADWVKLQGAVNGLAASLNRLGSADKVGVRLPNQKILDEDAPKGSKASAVQANIDANPDGFRQYAKTLAQYVNGINKAAAKRDLKTVYESAGELDGMCEGCHKAYWFPQGQ